MKNKSLNLKTKELLKRTVSCITAVAMIITILPLQPVMAYAEETGAIECTHHIHNEECGYAAAMEEVPCIHTHDENCGFVAAVNEALCECTDTDENGAVLHTENCGYTPAAEEVPCTHTHGESCGYTPAVAGTPCIWTAESCTECNPADDSEAEPAADSSSDVPAEETEPAVDDEQDIQNGEGEPVVECICETDDETFHATNCPLYTPVENPQCFCGEKCTEETLNYWCDVCGAQGAQACATTDTATVFEDTDIGGYCGAQTNDGGAESVVWGLTPNGTDDNGNTTYTITISGSGAMENFEGEYYVPWYDYREDITKAVIDNGITTIGDYAFYDSYMNEISLPDGLVSIGENAFYYCWFIEEISLPDSLISIGDDAFYLCGLLEEITIPDGVTSIGSGAFQECENLKEVTIPGSLNAIEGFTFCDCESLTTVNIGNGVQNIGEYAFAGCFALEEIVLPASVKSVDKYVFASCSSLTNITVDENNTALKDIDGVLFSKDGKTLVKYPVGKTATEYSIPQGVEIIETDAFKECTSLENITIPESVISINEHAFNGCSALAEVTVPKSVTNIGENAFSGCNNLTKVTIQGDASIGRNAFGNNKFLTDVTIAGKASLSDMAFNNCSRLATITFLSADVSISGDPFSLCYPINTVNVPCNWDINIDAFTGKLAYADHNPESGTCTICGNCSHDWENGECSFCQEVCTHSFTEGVCTVCKLIGGYCGAQTNEGGTESVTWALMPNGTDDNGTTYTLTIGGSGAMADYQQNVTFAPWYDSHSEYYYNITKVVIKEGITHIGELAFRHCSALQEITLPDGLISIGKFALTVCESLKELTIPDSVTSIGTGAFNYCSSLKEIIIPEGIDAVDERMFTYCSSLERIILPASVKNISFEAFNGCSALTDIIVDDNNTEYMDIDGVLLSKDGKTLVKYPIGKTATEYSIPQGVEIIGTDAFNKCTSLKNITLPESVVNIGENAFSDCDSLTEVIIPESVTIIGYSAFNSCNSLTKITLPENLNIGVSAFAYCKELTEVTIEDNTIIGDYAFSGCNSLTKVTFKDNISIGPDAFFSISSLKEIIFMSSDVEIETYAFRESTDIETVYVPCDWNIRIDGFRESWYKFADHIWENGQCTVCEEYCDHPTGEYIASGATITYTCDDCKLPTGTATITVQGKIYDDEAVTATVNRTGTLEDADYEVTYADRHDTAIITDSAVNAGEYTATLSVGSATAAADFEITPKHLTVAAVTVDNKIYDGTTAATVVGIALDGIVNTDDVTATATATFADKNAGTSKAVTVAGITLTGTDAANYTVDGTYLTTADITPAPITVTVNAGQSKIYGTEDPVFEYEITEGQLYGTDKLTGALGRTEGENVYIYDYELGTLANPNYEITLDTIDHFAILKARPDVSDVTATIADNSTAVADVQFYGVKGVDGNTLDGKFTVTSTEPLVWGDNVIKYIFTPADIANYITLEVAARVTVTDTIVPTGEVTVEENSWKEFINNITFGLLFNRTVDVKVTAADELSGLKSVEYFESSTPLTLSDVRDVTDWTDMGADHKVSVTAKPDRQFIYYIRITDNAGNVTYISTDGAEFDTQPPVINGITDGATYYTMQRFTVEERNLANVTVNGIQSMGFALGGNVDEEYVVVATDKAGNSTTVTVQMKTIDSISETIKDLTEENITGDSADTIKAVEDALAAVDTTNATEAEKAEIAAAQANIDSLQKVIADTADEVKALEETLAGYDKETVKSTDEAAVDQLIADLAAKLEDTNLTAQQKTALETALADAQALAQQIDDDKAALEDANSSVPEVDTENVTADNSDALADAKEKLEDIVDNDNYTEEQQKAAQEQIDKIEDLEEIIAETETSVDEAVAKEGYASKTEADITSAEKDDIEANLENIKELLDTDNLTEVQRETLEDTKAEAEALLKEIADNAQSLEDALEAEKDTTADNYTVQQKADLEGTAEDLEAVINSNNYTAEEKETAQEELNRINDIIKDIEEIEDTAEKAEDAADKQNNAEIVPDNKEAVEAAVKAKLAYEQLDIRQKELLGQEIAEQINKLYEKAVAFEIIKGANGDWTKGDGKGLQFTANGNFDLFISVKVDGKTIGTENYTAVAGSTVVTLNAGYLKSLKTAKHTLTVVYSVLGEEHTADCEFTVKAKPVESTPDTTTTPTDNVPKTGDNTNTVGWIAMMLSSMVALAVVLKKKREYEDR